MCSDKGTEFGARRSELNYQGHLFMPCASHQITRHNCEAHGLWSLATWFSVVALKAHKLCDL